MYMLYSAETRGDTPAAIRHVRLRRDYSERLGQIPRFSGIK